MIDGFRYGFTGQADFPLAIGVTVLIAVNTALLLLCFRLVASGYRLKA